jgi:hypothetical protein
LVWLLILSVVLAVLLTLLWLGRSVFDRSLPSINTSLPGWSVPVLLAVGTVIAVVALARFAVDGFAPHGVFPGGYAALYVGAVILLSLMAGRRSVSAR